MIWQAPVAHAYNPSYTRVRDQEDHGSKPAWENSSRDPISKKKKSQKRAGGVAQGVGPEFKSQYHTDTHTQSGYLSNMALVLFKLENTLTGLGLEPGMK
jgi:hypothetical protein